MPPLESILRTSDGLALTAEHHLRPGCRAMVVIVHGYAEHFGRYGELVTALGEAGYECHLLDLRGHGRSEGVRGFVQDFGDYLDDLDLLMERIGELHSAGGLSIASTAAPRRVLLGHSLGGLIALRYVLRRPEAFAAIAVGSPFLHPAVKVPAFKIGLASVISHLAPTYLMDGEIDSRWLSHDPAVAAAYDRDPLVFKTLSPHWFFAARAAQEEVLERAGEIRLPALFLLGGADHVADAERSRQVFERLGSADKRLEVYPGLFHELFNEVERARVVHDLLTWLAQPDRVAGLPPAR
jgi:alpha-beta hydrolase superfamily lysophospholipase